MNEVDRIKDAYRRRDSHSLKATSAYIDIPSLYIYQQREVAIIEALKHRRILDLGNYRILDVGCGTGAVLREFIKYGAQPENCCGLDLLPNRIALARRISPNIEFKCGNAEEMPYEDETFDAILCFTVLTSVLDPGMRKQIAKEMFRVLRPAGIVLLYDFHRNNPKNPDVRGLKKREIRTLFSGADAEFWATTLAPPLTRLLAPHSFILCRLLEKIRVLNTHFLAVIAKGISA